MAKTKTDWRQKVLDSWPSEWPLDEIVYCFKCGAPVTFTSESHDAGYHVEGCPTSSRTQEDFS